jgi:hypothetical protein
MSMVMYDACPPWNTLCRSGGRAERGSKDDVYTVSNGGHPLLMFERHGCAEVDDVPGGTSLGVGCAGSCIPWRTVCLGRIGVRTAVPEVDEVSLPQDGVDSMELIRWS